MDRHFRFDCQINDRVIREACALVERHSQDKAFLAQVESVPQYNFPPGHVQQSAQQVAAKIRGGRADTIQVKRWWRSRFGGRWSNMLAYERNGVIFINTGKYLNTIERAANIMHETMHVLGYKHAGNRNNEFNRGSVPYKVGDIFGEYLQGLYRNAEDTASSPHSLGAEWCAVDEGLTAADPLVTDPLVARVPAWSSSDVSGHHTNNVNGRYTHVDGHTEELRIDLKGGGGSYERPLGVVSFSSAEVHWVGLWDGQWSASSLNTNITIDIIYKRQVGHGTTYIGDAEFSSATVLEQATAMFVSGGGCTLLWNNLQFQFRLLSPYFDTLELEVDREYGVSEELHHAVKEQVLHLYRSVGFATSLLHNGQEVPAPSAPPGSNVRLWTSTTLNQAMTHYFSAFDNKDDWGVWVLLAKSYYRDERTNGAAYGTRGVMFDIDDESHREGCAVFVSAVANDPVPSFEKQLYRTVVHEIGHALNLPHAWVPGHAGNSWIPMHHKSDSVSFMNYPWRYESAQHGQGKRAYWEQFQGTFDDEELLFLRHAPREFVQPGKATWALLPSAAPTGRGTALTGAPAAVENKMMCREEDLVRVAAPIPTGHVRINVVDITGAHPVFSQFAAARDDLVMQIYDHILPGGMAAGGMDHKQTRDSNSGFPVRMSLRPFVITVDIGSAIKLLLPAASWRDYIDVLGLDITLTIRRKSSPPPVHSSADSADVVLGNYMDQFLLTDKMRYYATRDLTGEGPGGGGELDRSGHHVLHDQHSLRSLHALHDCFAAVGDSFITDSQKLDMLALIGLDHCHHQGFMGTGILIGQPDSGCNPSHVAFDSDRVLPGRNLLITPDKRHPGDRTGLISYTEHTHGISVGSVVAAKYNDETALSVAGAAPAAMLVPYRVTPVHRPVVHTSILTTTAQVNMLATAITAAVEDGCKVVSISLGTSKLFAVDLTNLERALNDAYDAGVIVVAAAGNYTAAFDVFPAAHPRVISCAACDWTGRPWMFSAFGDHVDVVAPGHNVVAATFENGAASIFETSGTSYATTHVAGTAACWWEKHNDVLKEIQTDRHRIVDAFRRCLFESCSSMGLWNVPLWRPFGHGLVNAQAALDYPLPFFRPRL